MSTSAFRVLFLAALASGLPGQALRYHLGLRVRAFERGFEPIHGDLAARQRVCPALERVVSSFFAVNLDEAGRQLDLARHALTGQPATPAVAWVDGLAVYPDARLLATDAERLRFAVRPLYTVDGAQPADLVLRVTLVTDDGRRIGEAGRYPLAALPLAAALPLRAVPEGDHRLHLEFLQADRVLARRQQRIGFVRDLPARLAEILPLASTPVTDTRTGTMRGLARLVRALSKGRTLETDIHAARLLRDLQRLRSGAPPLAGRTGDFRAWLHTGRGATAARVFVPAGIEPPARRPLVLALHGAGGSENLFFDGYGAGKIVELCRTRGWLLVAPRQAMIGHRASAARIVDELARALPVDRSRVFGIGHSMGGSQLIDQLGTHPKLFRAVAPLGGGGRVRPGLVLDGLPCFVAAGDRDFGRPMAEKLTTALQRARGRVTYRSYEATEHLGIVQVALADVFAFFDRTLER